MTDFDPIALYAILAESMGVWLWVLIAIAAVLLAGMVTGALRLRASTAGWRRPLLAALIGGLVATALAFWFVPAWSLADHGALAAPIDYLAALAIALVPGAMAAALLFSLASRLCARRRHRAGQDMIRA